MSDNLEVEKISEVDFLNLELAKSKKQLAVAGAKTAMAEGEAAELAYKNIVLQLFMKYKLTSSDSISEDGTINRGALVKSE